MQNKNMLFAELQNRYETNVGAYELAIFFNQPVKA